MRRQLGSLLWPHFPILQIYGANTGVGKTIFSSILCRAFKKRRTNVHYLKPVSTGALEEADDRHISAFGTNGIKSNCLYQFSRPVSPHLAARDSNLDYSDTAIQNSIHDEIVKYASNAGSSDGIALVETAGGVLSPSPSGSAQAGLYRPFRFPVLLVGDHRLGGIGTTISAWESLHMRGYDVEGIALFDDRAYENSTYLKEYFLDRDVHAFAIGPPPERNENPSDDAKAMTAFYENYVDHKDVNSFADRFLARHDQRIDRIRSAPFEAHQSIWHPFMQHSERSEDTIVMMDSAYGDFFQTYSKKRESGSTQSPTSSPENSLLKPAFDGSASWWTQGLGHGNPHLALTAAHAAGRYGHVMFAGAVHEPALTLAQTLIRGMRNPRLSKVFYTDNGSTGMEVAVKMALRATAVREGWSSEKDEVLILGLKGSYHGDTIGAMDCSEPSIFNKKVEWYRGRGYWFDFPQVKMIKGQWIVEMPEELQKELGGKQDFRSLDEIFAFEDRKFQAQQYREYFDRVLSRLRKEGKKLGALMMEPLLLGAGGMMFVDPLYQRCLVEALRQADSSTHSRTDWQGAPVIFDEVFTGLYRLGRFSAAEFLSVNPDIVVNAKLLTGGLVPLCTTTASESIFNSFLSDDKSDALLHGHSYTAHAVGCEVANESLRTMKKLEANGSWSTFRKEWDLESSSSSPTSSTEASRMWSMWSPNFLHQISNHPSISSVFAIGSVLSISIKGEGGYSSTAAADLRDRLFGLGASQQNNGEGVIHSRVLGNVLYLMTAMTTKPETVGDIEDRVLSAME